MLSIIASIDGDSEETSLLINSLPDIQGDDFEVIAICSEHPAEGVPGAEDVEETLAAQMAGRDVSNKVLVSDGEPGDMHMVGLEAAAGNLIHFAGSGTYIAPGISNVSASIMGSRGAQMMFFHVPVFDAGEFKYISKRVSNRHGNGRLPAYGFNASAYPTKIFQSVPGHLSSSVFDTEFLRENRIASKAVYPFDDDPMAFESAICAESLAHIDLPLARRRVNLARDYGAIDEDNAQRRLEPIASISKTLGEDRAQFRGSFVNWAVEYAMRGIELMQPESQDATMDFISIKLGDIAADFIADGIGGIMSGEGRISVNSLRTLEACGMDRLALVKRCLETSKLADEHSYDMAYMDMILEREGNGIPSYVNRDKRRKLFGH